MAKEDLIHIRLDYSESLTAKKDLLSSQMKLLKIAKTIKGYNFYRNKEIELKLILYKKIKELKTSMGKLQKALPTAEIPEILRKDSSEEKISISSKVRSPDKSIEDQLQEIQNRLDGLQRKNV